MARGEEGAAEVNRLGQISALARLHPRPFSEGELRGGGLPNTRLFGEYHDFRQITGLLPGERGGDIVAGGLACFGCDAG